MVTLALENLKENSVYQLLQSDMDFQQESNAEGCAEQSYIRLDLTEEQRQICNHLLDCRDSQNIDYSNCSYVAGLYDAFPHYGSPVSRKMGYRAGTASPVQELKTE